MADERPLAEGGAAKAAIDSGRTGDKVPMRDPATAPLYTDSEAGGSPTSRAAAAADTRRQERVAERIDPNIVPIAASGSRTAPATRRRAWVVGAILVALIVLALVLVRAFLPSA